MRMGSNLSHFLHRVQESTSNHLVTVHYKSRPLSALMQKAKLKRKHNSLVTQDATQQPDDYARTGPRPR